MGDWKLEVLRMCLYMAFPVGLFHYFNQLEEPDFLTGYKKQIDPEEEERSRKMIHDSIQQHNRQIELRKLEAMKRNIQSNSM